MTGSGEAALRVEFHDRTDYLLSVISGEYDMDEAVVRFGDLIQACRQWGHRKVLIDFRGLDGEPLAVEELIYQDSILDLFRLHLEADGAALKVAYLGKDPPSPWAEVGVEKARGQGLEAFVANDLDEAVEWLRGQGGRSD